MSVTIRPEGSGDAVAIHELTKAAFAGTPHSDGSEPHIVDALRRDGDLALSLVGEDGAAIVGHIAASPVAISDGSTRLFGLGPVSVSPERQGEGIGSALVRRAVADLRSGGARGLVVLGDPAFYARFGFEHDPALRYPGPPPKYFQFLLLEGQAPRGEVRYALAFG